jgi:hypothetical protein
VIASPILKTQKCVSRVQIKIDPYSKSPHIVKCTQTVATLNFDLVLSYLQQ